MRESKLDGYQKGFELSHLRGAASRGSLTFWIESWMVIKKDLDYALEWWTAALMVFSWMGIKRICYACEE